MGRTSEFEVHQLELHVTQSTQTTNDKRLAFLLAGWMGDGLTCREDCPFENMVQLLSAENIRVKREFRAAMVGKLKAPGLFPWAHHLAHISAVSLKDEKAELVAKVSALEKALKDAQASSPPAPASHRDVKVRRCFDVQAETFIQLMYFTLVAIIPKLSLG